MTTHCETDIGCDNPDCETCNPICEYCGGTGEIPADETDESGNIMRGVNLEKCGCMIKEKEYDGQE